MSTRRNAFYRPTKHVAHPEACHCGSGKRPSTMRQGERFNDPIGWCCGECYGGNKRCAGQYAAQTTA